MPTITDTNANKTYFIDQIVLGYLLKITDPVELDKAYSTYLEETYKVISEAVNSYFDGIDIPEDQKQSIKNLLSQTVFNKDADKQLDKAPDYLTKQQLDSPEVQKRIQSAINAINKGIYLEYQSKLTPEEKAKLNEYLKTMEETIKIDMQNTIDLMKLVEEYDSLKTKTNAKPNPIGTLPGVENKTVDNDLTESTSTDQSVTPAIPQSAINPIEADTTVTVPEPQQVQPQTQGMPAFNPNPAETKVPKDPIFSEPVQVPAPAPQPQTSSDLPQEGPAEMPTQQIPQSQPTPAARQQTDPPAINLTSL